ncbi:hypothetical protein KEM54_004392, partial [Ascosphaera aggregata]
MSPTNPAFPPVYLGQTRAALLPPDAASLLPREEDVLMALQLLAYVSKYTALRSYFQQCHFVPRLKIEDEDLKCLDGNVADGQGGHKVLSKSTGDSASENSFNSGIDATGEDAVGSAAMAELMTSNFDTEMDLDDDGDDVGSCDGADDCEDTCDNHLSSSGTSEDGEDDDDSHSEKDDRFEEFLLPDDQNIFPIVEMFTVRHSHHHSHHHQNTSNHPRSAYPYPTFSTPTPASESMRYWACVVMRNLCRKDEKRGGIR